MVNIDDLRGTPLGHTTNSSTSSTSLKNAAATLLGSAMVATATPQQAVANEVGSENKSDHKVELSEAKPTPTRDETALDYAQEAQNYRQQERAAGIDVKYYPESEAYTIGDQGGNAVVITEKELHYNKVAHDYEASFKEKFSRPTEYRYVDADIVNVLTGKIDNIAHYSDADNSITIYNIKINDREEALKLVAQIAPELSPAERESELDSYVKRLNDPDYKEGVLKHEEGHRDDDRAGFFKPDVSPEHRTKLDMMGEIKSSMIEAGVALEKFKQKGDLSSFDNLNFDMTKIKEELANNPHAPDIEKKIAATIYSGWQETYNVPDSKYSKQSYQNADSQVIDVYSAAAKITQSQDMDKRYYDRVNTMFSNIPGLGDVRSCVDPDFKLNADLKSKVEGDVKVGTKSAQFIDGLVAKAKTLKQATRKLRNFFHKVKKADGDGIRTTQEQRQIDKRIAKICFLKSGRIQEKSGFTTNNKGRENVNANTSSLQKIGAAKSLSR